VRADPSCSKGNVCWAKTWEAVMPTPPIHSTDRTSHSRNSPRAICNSMLRKPLSAEAVREVRVPQHYTLFLSSCNPCKRVWTAVHRGPEGFLRRAFVVARGRCESINPWPRPNALGNSSTNSNPHRDVIPKRDYVTQRSRGPSQNQILLRFQEWETVSA